MTHNIDLIDEESIEVLRREWLEHYAPLDFRHPDYIDWEDFCLQTVSHKNKSTPKRNTNHG